MLAILSECPIRDIPHRLHSAGRPVLLVSSDDKLYIRHPPLAGRRYVFEIPGHASLKDQSANSHQLNTPHGKPRDVLYDTRRGQHYFSHQIACVEVAEVVSLSLPNTNSIVRDHSGEIKKEADVFTFEIVHEPTPCMYPHCVIYLLKNRTRPKDVASSMKTRIRLEFARIAERHRRDMIWHQYSFIRKLRLLTGAAIALLFYRFLTGLLGRGQ